MNGIAGLLPVRRFADGGSTASKGPYYTSEDGTLHVWTGSGYHAIPVISGSDVGDISRPIYNNVVSSGDAGNGAYLGDGTETEYLGYGITDGEKYGLPYHSNNWQFDGARSDKDNLYYMIKSDDKVGTQIKFVRQEDGSYKPEFENAVGWDTNNSAQNMALLSIAAGPLLQAGLQGAGLAANGTSSFGASGALINSVDDIMYAAAGAGAGAAGTAAANTINAYGYLDYSQIPPGTTVVDPISNTVLGVTNGTDTLTPPSTFETDYPTNTTPEPPEPPQYTPEEGPYAPGESPGTIEAPPETPYVPENPGPYAPGENPTPVNNPSGSLPTPTPPPNIGDYASKIADWIAKNPQLAMGIVGTVGSLIDDPDDDPATGGGGSGSGGGWNGPVPQMQAVQAQFPRPAGYRPGFSPEHVYTETAYRAGDPTKPVRLGGYAQGGIVGLPRQRYAQGGIVGYATGGAVETWDSFAAAQGLPVERPTDPLGAESWDSWNNVFKLRQQNMTPQNTAQWVDAPTNEFPTYAGTGDVRGYITGGARSSDGSQWDFYDQGGNTITSIPYADFASKYTTSDGSMNQNAGAVNGYDFYYSDAMQAKLRDERLRSEALRAAQAGPGAAVNTGNGTGNWMVDPVTGKVKYWGGSLGFSGVTAQPAQPDGPATPDPEDDSEGGTGGTGGTGGSTPPPTSGTGGATPPPTGGIGTLPSHRLQRYQSAGTAPNPWDMPSGIRQLIERDLPTPRFAGAYGANPFASGGFVQGPGTETSDSIPAMIDGKQPAALSKNEFVLPAWLVEEIGDGSPETGAQRLYAFMNQMKAKRSASTNPEALLSQLA